MSDHDSIFDYDAMTGGLPDKDDEEGARVGDTYQDLDENNEVDVEAE